MKQTESENMRERNKVEKAKDERKKSDINNKYKVKFYDEHMCNINE